MSLAMLTSKGQVEDECIRGRRGGLHVALTGTPGGCSNSCHWLGLSSRVSAGSAEPSYRQGAALLDQGHDSLSHGMTGKAILGVKFARARRQ